MAHYARLNSNNIVEQVIVISNEDEMVDGVENEEKGIAFCRMLFGPNTNWKKTSYNGNIRKNYAGIGYSYNPNIDAFVAPKPFPSWNLNADAIWMPPIPYPEDGKMYAWHEDTLSWSELEQPAPLTAFVEEMEQDFTNKSPEELVKKNT